MEYLGNHERLSASRVLDEKYEHAYHMQLVGDDTVCMMNNQYIEGQQYEAIFLEPSYDKDISYRYIACKPSLDNPGMTFELSDQSVSIDLQYMLVQIPKTREDARDVTTLAYEGELLANSTVFIIDSDDNAWIVADGFVPYLLDAHSEEMMNCKIISGISNLFHNL